MNTKQLLAAACAMACAAAFAGPFDAFKGKMKEGQYEMKMDMEMPGMPAGMGKQSHTMTHCVTKEDIEKGQMGKGGKKDAMPENCEVKDMNMSGNTATYKVVCKGGKNNQPDMTTDNKVTFRDNGYTMDMKMSMNQGGQVMNMNQHMESRYMGACTK